MRRKPTALKKIDGTFRKDRVRKEPTPAQPDNLEPPIKLDRHGKAFWSYHASRLQKLGLLTECDTYSLAVGCEWWSVHQRALKAVRRSLVHSTEANGECSKPEIQIAKTAFANLKQIMIGFGLDPQSRGKLHVEPPEQPDKIADLYFKKRA